MFHVLPEVWKLIDDVMCKLHLLSSMCVKTFQHLSRMGARVPTDDKCSLLQLRNCLFRKCFLFLLFGGSVNMAGFQCNFKLMHVFVLKGGGNDYYVKMLEKNVGTQLNNLR